MSGGKRKSAGRPIEVDGGENTSIRLGVKERRIVAAASRHMLGGNSTSNRSRVIRQMIRTSWESSREDLKESWKKDIIIADLQSKLQASEAKVQSLETQLIRARRPRGKETILQVMLRAKEEVSVRVARGDRSPLGGDGKVDQVWMNRDRSWPRVLQDILLAEDQGVWPPRPQVVAR